jgi:hypothetical protein
VEVEEEGGIKIKICVPLTESNVKCLLGESLEFVMIEMIMDLRVYNAQGTGKRELITLWSIFCS